VYIAATENTDIVRDILDAKSQQ